MPFPTQDGTKSYGSKFRASRYDRENAPTEDGPRAQAHDIMGTGERPNADSRLHNNPHAEKFNMPLTGPTASADEQEPGAEQAQAHDEHTVTCPHCGGEVSTGGGASHSDEMAPMSETEKDVDNDKVAKGVWKPGQREHPDAGGDTDDYQVEPL